VAACVGFAATTATADPSKVECIDAHEQGQRLRKLGQWQKARERFVTCAVDACPGPIQQECGPWLKELDDSLPSVIFSVRDERGRAIAGAQLQVDDSPPMTVPATAFALDPGLHKVRVFAQGYVENTISETLRERERGRILELVLRSEGNQVSKAPTAAPIAPFGPTSSGSANIPAWTALGATGLALGSFIVFSALGRSLESDRADTCAPLCSRDAVAPIERYYAVADVSLVASVILAGVTAVLFYVRPGEGAKRAKRVQDARAR
jgi:hypothetical protein